MDKIFRLSMFLMIHFVLMPSLYAQDKLNQAREGKKAVQAALRKKMGPLRNEEAVNAMTKQFENVSLKKETIEDEPKWIRGNMIPGCEEWCCLYDNEFPKKAHPLQ